MQQLPAGTVTFVFTDIEGSTALLQRIGEDAYADSLAAHKRLLRDVFQSRGGKEVNSQGDGFLYAFQHAPDAVAAAARAQAALASGPVRVRMGLHTGEPQLTADGYVGLDLHKGARIAAIGHGGQVLLSQTTRELVEADVFDLGEHRLKDFAEPAWVFQLGQVRFPPLKSISNTNLPHPASSFVGREREVSDVVSLLRGGKRLVTLTGPGGTGKTRLGIESAAELVPEYRNGVFWVALAAIRDPTLVIETAAQSLGAKEDLASHIGDRELLLLLDNFEHVMDAAAAVSSLLRACANLSVLVTSREMLHIEGEVGYAVPPLSDQAAVELFCTRAQLASDETTASLCRRLENLPLAVELAAARTAVLSPAQILERLSRRLDFLEGGRDAEVRQRTLRATIEWSHDLLSDDERRLFANLSIFAGGCTLAAAEEVCSAPLDTLQSLVDKSLLRRTGDRFWMLETIREFAAERFEQSGEAQELRNKHATYFLELFEADDDALRNGRQTLSGYVGLVKGERDNARRALDRFRAIDDQNRAARMTTALHPLWIASPIEGRQVLEHLLTQDGVVDQVRGRALWAAGTLAMQQGDSAAAKRHLEEALPILTQLGDRRSLSEVLRRLGGASILDRQFERAEQQLRESETIAADIGDLELVAAAAQVAGLSPLYQGAYAVAEVRFTRALQLAREAEDPAREKYALISMGYAILEQGRLAEAASLLQASLSIHLNLTLAGDDRAIDGLAAIAVARGDAESAARLLGATREWRRNVGFQPPPFEAAIFDRAAQAARTALDEHVYSELQEEGAALSLDEAVAVGLALEN